MFSLPFKSIYIIILKKHLKDLKETFFEELHTTFNEMKSLIAAPKVFLFQHFESVRNQIDIECQKYLDNNELKLESKEKALLKQQEMIDGVDSFQKQCLASLKTKQIHQINLEDFEKRFQSQDKDDVMQLGKDLCCAIHSIKRELFMNQGIVFYTNDNYEKLFESYKRLDLDTFGHNKFYRSYSRLIDSGMFGSLVRIEDDFLINSDTFESWAK